MRKIGLLLMIVLFGTTMLMAQNRDGQRRLDPKEMAKKQTEELKEALDLDEKQETQIYAINLNSAEKMSAMREEMRSSDGDRDSMREKMGKLRNEQNEEMKKVLSEEQYEKYQKYLEERRKQLGGGKRGSRQ